MIRFSITVELKLPNPEGYSAHSVRRSTATNAAENDCTPDQLCALMGWKTHKMTRVYIQNSKKMKTKTANQIFGVPTSNVNDASQVFAPASRPSTSGLSGLAVSVAQDERLSNICF